MISIIREIKAIELLIDKKNALDPNALDILLDSGLSPNKLNDKDAVEIINSINNLLTKITDKTLSIIISDAFLGKLLELFIQNPYVVQQSDLDKLLKSFRSLFIMINEKEKFSKDEKEKFFNLFLFRIAQNDCNLDNFIKYHEFLLCEIGKKYSANDEKQFLIPLVSKMNKESNIAATSIHHLKSPQDKTVTPIESLNNLQEKKKISDNFMNNLLHSLIQEINNQSNMNIGLLVWMKIIINYRVINSQEKIIFIEKIIKTMLRKYKESPKKNFYSAMILLKFYLDLAMKANYKIDISEIDLENFSDLLLNNAKTVLCEELSRNGCTKKNPCGIANFDFTYQLLATYTFDQLYMGEDIMNEYLNNLFAMIYNLVKVNKRDDNEIEISNWALELNTKLCIQFFRSNITFALRLSFNEKSIILIKSLHDSLNTLSPVDIKINILQKIQKAIDKERFWYNEFYRIKLQDSILDFNLWQLKSIKNSSPKFYSIIFNVLHNYESVELMKLSVEKPFSNLDFHQCIIQDCNNKIIAIISEEYIQDYNKKISLDSPECKKGLLSMQEKFLCDSINLIRSSNKYNNKENKNKNNVIWHEKYLNDCLQSVRNEWNANQNSSGSIGTVLQNIINIFRQKNNKDNIIKI